MKIILTIVPFVLFSCRTFPHYPQVYNYIYDEEAYFKGKECSFNGKIFYKGKELARVAVKININADYCEMAYSDFDGYFSFCLDTTKINKNSYIEFVLKDYQRKRIWLDKFLKSDKIVELKKGSKNISETEYLEFYENIRSCTRFSDIVED